MQTGWRGRSTGGGDLTITSEALDGGVRLFALEGELDSRNADRVYYELEEAINRGAGSVLLDLSALTFCDSSGLEAIVSAYHRVTMAGGRLALVANDNRLLRVFQVTRLDRLLGVCATRADALDRLESRPPARRWRFRGRPTPRPRPAA